jgi:ABC-type lipoprotein export system ATPase subunit
MDATVLPDPALPSNPAAHGPIIHATGLWKSFDRGRIRVLQGIDLIVRPGETLALCGASGSGKSTLLNILGGLDSPDHGEVLVAGSRIHTADERTRLLRHTVGFVFQLHNLIADLTLRENCLVPALAAGVHPREADARIQRLLALTGIAHRANRRVQELSGGERQRTALCRALVNQPRLLLADEPTGSLDEENGARVFELLLELVRRENLTLVLATHDRALAERCRRLVLVRDGRIVHDG